MIPGILGSGVQVSTTPS